MFSAVAGRRVKRRTSRGFTPWRGRPLSHGSQPQEVSAFGVDDHQERTIGSLGDIANAASHEHSLFGSNAVAIEL
jgi:hypothetical protein